MSRTALVLMSGGLDSTLAAKLMLEQGIQVQGLYLSSPWGCDTDVQRVSRELGISLKVVEKGSAYVELVRNPKYGYGKNMNPCIDCRIYMFELAKKVMDEKGADFIVTGEVLGQRPMSQRYDAMIKIDQESGMEGLVLRPLSARYLPLTLPEREGWVDREKLLDVQGRSRSIQIRLAEEFGLKEYASPAGGCLLTDEEFSVKLLDFFEHQQNPSINEARLLRFGRHFRINEKVKVILGRNQGENQSLREIVDHTMTMMEPLGFPGPIAVITGEISSIPFELFGGLILEYSKKAGDAPYEFFYQKGDLQGKFLLEKPYEGFLPSLIHSDNLLLTIQK